MMKRKTKSTNVVAAVLLVLLVQHIQLKKRNHGISRSFNNNWLQDPELKVWIEADSKDRFVVRCKVCDFSLSNINKSSLLAHKMTQKHVKNFEFKKEMTNIKTFFVTPKTPSLREQVAKAE